MCPFLGVKRSIAFAKSAQRHKVYEVRADNLNSLELNPVSTVHLASGDAPETVGDKTSTSRLSAAASIARVTQEDARLSQDREGHSE